MQDELTKKMHGELAISAATEIKHRVFTALMTIDEGLFSREEAMEVYNLRAKQLDKYEPHFRKLDDTL